MGSLETVDKVSFSRFFVVIHRINVCANCYITYNCIVQYAKKLHAKLENNS
jgi:hypothetical protein